MNICLLVLGRGAAKVNRKKQSPLFFFFNLLFACANATKRKSFSLCVCVREKRRTKKNSRN